MDIPPGFEIIRADGLALLLRSTLRHWLEPILRAAPDGWPGYSVRQLSGGRGGVAVVTVGENETVLRPYRRGGLPARCLRATYCGWRPRPFHELYVTEMLRHRGVAAVEVQGAVVQWSMPGLYRGWLATRYVGAAHTLWAWVRTKPPAADRARVFAQVGRSVRRLHAYGACHPDLNLNNVLVCAQGPSIDIVLIDFDRARLGAMEQSAAPDLARFERSARKLDPHRQWVTAADLEAVRTGYAQERPS